MFIRIKKTLQIAASFLRVYENPKLEAEVLLGSLLGKERAWIKSHDQDGLSLGKIFKFSCWVFQRRFGKPLAYIRGYQDWHGQKFIVNRHVLIPRDETETLLRHILDTKYKILPRNILDVGTGSGCLAVELKCAFAMASVTGLDISNKALSVARGNADLHQQVVDFKYSDLLSAIPEAAQFDIIVANLPYVPETVKVTRDVKQEPHNAIFSGIDGFDHLRRFEMELKSKKIVFKSLWLEFLPSQKDGISKIFKDYQVEFKGDVAGNLFFAKIT